MRWVKEDFEDEDYEDPEEWLNDEVEDDIITSSESGFMLGYLAG